MGARYSCKTFKPRYEKFIEGTHMATIALPKEQSFEAPAIEEYLIKRLQPKLNELK